MPDGKQTPASSIPVEYIPMRSIVANKLEHGIALCLSGGGYRAMLFHVGALIRLNEFGMVGQIASSFKCFGRIDHVGRAGLELVKIQLRRERTNQQLRRTAGATLTTDGRKNHRRDFRHRRSVHQRKHQRQGNRCLSGLALREHDAPTNSRQAAFCFQCDQRAIKGAFPIQQTVSLGLASRGASTIRRWRLRWLSRHSSAFPPVLSPAELHFNPSDFVPGTGGGLCSSSLTHPMSCLNRWRSV